MLEIQGFLNQVSKKKQEEEDLLMLSHMLCKTYGWDYHTLMKQPIPFVFDLVKMMKKEADIKEKEMKKAKRRR